MPGPRTQGPHRWPGLRAAHRAQMPPWYQSLKAGPSCPRTQISAARLDTPTHWPVQRYLLAHSQCPSAGTPPASRRSDLSESTVTSGKGLAQGLDWSQTQTPAQTQPRPPSSRAALGQQRHGDFPEESVQPRARLWPSWRDPDGVWEPQIRDTSGAWSRPLQSQPKALVPPGQRRPRHPTRTLWETDISVDSSPTPAPVGQTQE